MHFHRIAYCLSFLLLVGMNSAQAQERTKTTVFISPSLGFIPEGINSMQGLSAGIILPINKTVDGYIEMLGMSTLSTGIEDSFDLADWHESTHWGFELGVQYYLKLEQFDFERYFQLSGGLMYRSGSQEQISQGSERRQSRNFLRSYQFGDETIFTSREKLHDLGLSLGLAYEVPWWEGITSYGGGKVYLSPSGNHFMRFTFQVFYDL